MGFWLIILVVFQHFLFDWILQSRWIAVNKSHGFLALILHVVVVTIGFFLPAIFVFGPLAATSAAIFYGLLHGLQDRYVWKWYGKRGVESPYDDKWFWNTIAIDQFLHFLIMFSILVI
jgi:hypothetical protein